LPLRQPCGAERAPLVPFDQSLRVARLTKNKAIENVANIVGDLTRGDDVCGRVKIEHVGTRTVPAAAVRDSEWHGARTEKLVAVVTHHQQSDGQAVLTPRGLISNPQNPLRVP
jgi:hypothetical protein